MGAEGCGQFAVSSAYRPYVLGLLAAAASGPSPAIMPAAGLARAHGDTP